MLSEVTENFAVDSAEKGVNTAVVQSRIRSLSS